MTLPLLWLGIFASLVVPATHGEPLPVDLRSSVIGAIGGYMSLWLVYQAYKLVTRNEAWVSATSSCSRRSAPGSAGRCCCHILIAAVVGGVGYRDAVDPERARATPIAFGRFWRWRAG